MNTALTAAAPRRAAADALCARHPSSAITRSVTEPVPFAYPPLVGATRARTG